MDPICKTRMGIQAGLLAGAAIAGLFFLLDLLHLQPLATPLALSNSVLGPAGPSFDTPVVSQAVGIVALSGNLLAFSILHFLAFSFLGVAVVWGCDRCRIPLNVWTGAVWGLTVGTAAFYGCMALFGQAVLAEAPGFSLVLMGNLAAGLVMGGFAQIAVRPKTTPKATGTA